MLHRICAIGECTSCNACENICRHKAVKRMYSDDMSWEMGIDDDACIGCGMCQKVCPTQHDVLMHMPQKAFAAWSAHKGNRKMSASGGIATELYIWAIKNEMVIIGASMDDNYEVHLKPTVNASDIAYFRNSKYTFSFADNIYNQVVYYMKQGQGVLFIGIPCQVAAVQNFVKLHKSLNSNLLLTVDLVCHGTPPPDYLKQHIKHISKGRNTKSVFFRDPRYKTERYSFSLYEKKTSTSPSAKPYYHKFVYDNDFYQIAYHKAMAYRPSCYSCKYARKERISDITLGDYSGLGKMAPWKESANKVSLVLINTEKGNSLFCNLCMSGKIISHERPIEEPISSERQLNKPSEIPSERTYFLQELKRTANFEMAASIAFAKIAKKQHFSHLLKIRELRQIVASLIPQEAKIILKKIRNEF